MQGGGTCEYTDRGSGVFTDGPDTSIGATLYGVKAKKGSQSTRKLLFPSWTETSIINPTMAAMMQLLLVHGIDGAVAHCEIPLFPCINRNQMQKGQEMASDAYNANVKDIFHRLGIADNATEHSPRRGSCGFRYYVLSESPEYIRDFIGHVSFTATFSYIGFGDKQNTYVSQEYGTCASAPIR